MPDHIYSPRPHIIAIWLLGVAALVFAMVVVGGITRLTESGLSITEWKPISGALPPLSQAQWMEAFAKYQQTPEYQQINRGMSLADFQFIFFWEWSHRLLGRLIGLAFALPLAWFAARRAIPRGYGWRLIALLALGGLQGAIGWWMVASGLVTRTDVSHYRLAVHLVTALFIIAGLVWTALDLLDVHENRTARPAKLLPCCFAAGTVLFVQLIWGAYVAGLNAGYVANDWPLMNGRLFPDGVTAQGSLWATLSSDPYLVHFIHRWWAWVVFVAMMMLARAARKAGARRAAIALSSTVGAQILLGIFTVLSGNTMWLAVLHQANGAFLVASAVWAMHSIGRQAKTG